MDQERTCTTLPENSYVYSRMLRIMYPAIAVSNSSLTSSILWGLLISWHLRRCFLSTECRTELYGKMPRSRADHCFSLWQSTRSILPSCNYQYVSKCRVQLTATHHSPYVQSFVQLAKEVHRLVLNEDPAIHPFLEDTS